MRNKDKRAATSAQNGRAGGRPKAFATVRIPIEDAKPVLDIILERYNTMERTHPAERGMVFLIAGLQAELVR